MHVAETLKYTGRLLWSRLRHTPTLVFASLYPTFRCNLECTYCNFPMMRTPELITDQWKSIVDQLADLGCLRVSILGGEPLLRTDLAEIIEHVNLRGMSCVLTSNGLLVPERIEWLRRLSTLILSLDALGPANDGVRGAGVFESVKKSIEVARRNGIPVKINAVLSSRTASGLDDLLGFIEEHNLCITLNVMRSGTPRLWRNAVSIKDDDESIKKMLVRIARRTKGNARILFSETTYRFASQWDDYSKDRYVKNELPPDSPLARKSPPCHAGRYYMTILSDGSVAACMNTMEQNKAGNVIDDGVAAAWRSLRDHRCVTCYSPCLVELNYLFSLHPQVVRNFISRHWRRFY